MKTQHSTSIAKIIILLCFFVFGNNYGQGKKATNKVLFGKTVQSGKTNPKKGITRCATVEYEEFLQRKNPKRMSEAAFEAWLNPLVKKHQLMRTTSKMVATVITIPVVVHVIHSGQPIGVAPNITDAQVQSQITVLNQDYRRMIGTPGHNTNPVGADVEVEFVLALQDPNGNPTNGIDRVNLFEDSWLDEDIETTVKPATIWDPTQYLNMWCVQFSGNDLLGYAQAPDGSGLGGLDPSGGAANTDGVVASYDVFGSKTYDDGTFILQESYDRGRTMTHEVGHWLGLRHIWGDGGSRYNDTKDCNATDYCADTPQAGWENYDCITSDSCPAVAGNDMIENYMDYTNDECMNIFTQNQKDRILVIMNNAARRSSLKTSTKDSAIPLFALDAEVKIEASKVVITAENVDCNTAKQPSNKQVAIYNRGTAILTAVTLNYNIDGGANQVYTWTGSLAQHQSAVVTLANTNSYGTLNVSVTATNGATDQRASNNTATTLFTVPANPTNYSFNTVTFKLQQDKWGSETTWSLDDSSGTSLYSGGPYEDKASMPALITQNWTLASNECYTFTINDSQGDGICCGDGGDGYFELKSTSGATIILSGKEFGAKEDKSFTIKSLGTSDFELFNAIFLYPNPTKGTLNIQVPANFGLPSSYTISTVLGQNISQKEVTKEADLIVNTSTLSNGIYFITVVKEDQKRTLRFIKE